MSNPTGSWWEGGLSPPWFSEFLTPNWGPVRGLPHVFGFCFSGDNVENVFSLLRIGLRGNICRSNLKSYAAYFASSTNTGMVFSSVLRRTSYMISPRRNFCS